MFLGGLFFEWIQTVLILAGYVSGNATFPKPLNKSEEKKYLDLYAKGDESAKNVLIEHNLRLVAHIAKKYADEKNLEDLISIGTIGLIKGINTFNPEKNSRLSTYISRCIENEVLMVMRSSKKLQNEISIDESIGTDRENIPTMAFSDILTCDSTDIARPHFRQTRLKKTVQRNEKILAPAEINILCWRYGLGNQPRKRKEIADILGISPLIKSQQNKKCLERLLDELKRIRLSASLEALYMSSFFPNPN